jgi:GntR family transcriptional regulator, transcriptional repressor for pyruvate dehydrogenase complex
MEFKELKKQSLAESVSLEILEMIRAKKIQPGDKLPPERELATMMGISRPSLREALRALSIMNIVEIRQGDGIYVTSLKPADLVEHLEFVFSLDDSTVIQLFEARKIVEPGIAELAAINATEEDLKVLQELRTRSIENAGNLEKFLTVDIQLHGKIVEMAHNPILKRIHSSLTQLSSASRLRTGRIPGVIPRTVTDHDAIIHAISNHDPQQARQAMYDHLNFVEESFINTAVKSPGA